MLLTPFKKHFKQKNLIILRSCNELLRRLSRAEDTVFCGRVFIFLFQSFPLGDKSAVNLRGEYHTENVTTFDNLSKDSKIGEDDVHMTDPKESTKTADEQKQETEPPSVKEEDKLPERDTDDAPKVTISRSEEPTKERPLDLDSLYPIFWGLQAYFSAPTKVFDAQHFAKFKTGLESTLSAFKSVNNDLETSNSKTQEEVRKSTKRKRTADGPEIAGSFNPKYLTSRELFDLEVLPMANLIRLVPLTALIGERHGFQATCPGSSLDPIRLYALTYLKVESEVGGFDQQVCTVRIRTQ